MPQWVRKARPVLEAWTRGLLRCSSWVLEIGISDPEHCSLVGSAVTSAAERSPRPLLLLLPFWDRDFQTCFRAALEGCVPTVRPHVVSFDLAIKSQRLSLARGKAAQEATCWASADHRSPGQTEPGTGPSLSSSLHIPHRQGLCPLPQTSHTLWLPAPDRARSSQSPH